MNLVCLRHFDERHDSRLFQSEAYKQEPKSLRSRGHPQGGQRNCGACQYYIENSISLHKLGATMTWYVISSVRENAQKIPRANIEIKAVRVRTLEGQNHDGNNAVDSLMFNQSQYNRNNTDRRVRHLLHHPEAICVVAMKYIRTHEGKNRHDIVQNRIWCQTS